MKNKKTLSQILSKYGVLMVFVVMFVFFSFASPNFFKASNFMKVSRQINTLGICAVGMTILLIAGGIDLSLGYQLSLVNVVCAWLMTNNVNWVLAVLLTLLMCAGIGAINGLIIVKSGVHPMIITLAVSQVLQGASFLISKGVPIFGFPTEFSAMGQKSLFGVLPISLIIMVVIFIIGYIILAKVPYGRYLYAIGSNEEAAKLAGVNTAMVRFTAHTLCGLLTGIAGILLLSRTNSGMSNNGAGFEFNVITACVLGGVSNLGGRGNIYQALLGVLIMGFLENGMVMLGINAHWQLVITGTLLGIAVSYDSYMVRSSERVKKLKSINPENVE